MYLKQLTLQNFRNHTELHINIPPAGLIITGANGSGKTAILEAISIISLTRSFRDHKLQSIINYNADFLNIKAETNNYQLTYICDHHQKSLQKNGVKQTPLTFIGLLPSIIFHPDNEQIITSSPTHRRNFLNILLAQTDPNYHIDLLQLQKILKQRSALLKAIQPNLDELSVWSEKLAEYTAKINIKRIAIIKKLNLLIPPILQQISPNDEPVALTYSTTLTDKLAILKQINAKLKLDLLLKQNSIGPHRDDLLFHNTYGEIAKHNSRGQNRATILALKIAEVKLVKDELGVNPLILLDDVFSELDSEHQNKLLQFLPPTSQIIITTTDTHSIKRTKLDNLHIK